MRLVHRIYKSGKELRSSLESIFKISKDPEKSLTTDQFVHEANRLFAVFINYDEAKVMQTILAIDGKITFSSLL